MLHLGNRDLLVTFGTPLGLYQFSLREAAKLNLEIRSQSEDLVDAVIRDKPMKLGGGGPHRDLFVVAWVRLWANGAGMLDLSIEAPWLSSSDTRYDLEVMFVGQEGNDRALLQRANVVHGRWQRKILAFDNVGQIPPLLPYSRLDLQRDGAIPNYLHTLQVDDDVIENRKRKWESVVAKDPLNADLGRWVAYQGHTGDDDGIGLVPGWWAEALVSGDPDLLRICHENDRLFGGFPIHVRDETTWRPLSVLDHPTLMLAHPDPPASQVWRKFDDAHHPLAGAMSALLFQDPLMEEEVEFVANWLDLNSNAGYRAFDLGLCIDNEQRRATAWNLRTKFWAGRFLPRKERFARTIDANLERLKNTLSDRYHGIRVEGSKTPWFCNTESRYNPSYNESYLLTVLEWARTMFPDDPRIVVAQSTLARWPIARHRQWPMGTASPYLAAVADKASGDPYSIQEAYGKTFENKPAGKTWSWRGTRGFGAHDRAALCGAKRLGVEGAEDALARCEAAMNPLRWNRDPLWALSDEGFE